MLSLVSHPYPSFLTGTRDHVSCPENSSCAIDDHLSQWVGSGCYNQYQVWMAYTTFIYHSSGDSKSEIRVPIDLVSLL